eukprot:CAMPEP_0114998238 /NCGR_PEP_ID=MMETSP0216-20121206/15379_1 /TAXON_ID=223996 /ORGANISM="Protocruzia adherens, Strain Boccale" /LENGTH=250 /DNA_ID=CAMNT_0002362779 /DNA_START=56 /DNA_END=805 /DNA_ORIENTATION=+
MFGQGELQVPLLRSPNGAKKSKLTVLLKSLCFSALIYVFYRMSTSERLEESTVQIQEREASCKGLLVERGIECPSGWYWIRQGKNARKVFCDMEQGGWMVILERQKGGADVDFGRGFQEYADGFGVEHNFIESLVFVNQFCQEHPSLKLKVEMSFEGVTYVANYAHFEVASQQEEFKLTLGGFSSPSGLEDDFGKHDQLQFTTIGIDNDQAAGYNCVISANGAGFWYDACWHVLFTGQLNNPESFKGLHW